LPALQNIALCGDAAGMTKPWSGGGILWAFMAADILVRSFPDFQKYRQEVRAFFGPSLFRAKFLMPFVYFAGFHLPFLLPAKMALDNDLLRN